MSSGAPMKRAYKRRSHGSLAEAAEGPQRHLSSAYKPRSHKSLTEAAKARTGTTADL